MDEFDFIRDVLAPLAGEGAFGLTDDAAVLRAGAGALVVTADMLVEGRHFTVDCPPETVAKKALRVNLSDVAWPAGRDLAWKQAFVRGLAEDQARYGVSMLGGDTTVTDGPFTVAITAFGAPAAPEFEGRAMVRRSSARPGHAVYVTGDIGAPGLGLRALEGQPMPAGTDTEALVAAYRLPQPAVAVAPAVAAHAAAAIDVSDGLLADAAHIARQSGVCIVLDLDAAALSAAAQAWLEAQQDRAAALAALAASGDDYQILLTAPEGAADALGGAGREAGIRLTRIGHVEAGQGLRVHAAGAEIRPDRLGFTHF